MSKSVVVIGAGPAGLTAGYLLAKAKVPVVVIEADPQYVGGISRTVDYKGFHFDIGGHRFFSKSQDVEDFWTEILPDDLLVRPRLSRIFYKRKLFSYPLKPFEALWKLGLFESSLCVLSYLRARLFPVKNPANFEDWVSNQFGHRLFNIFFKTYTEKVWGMSCRQISADWAAQRIRGLSLSSAILNAFKSRRPKDRREVIKTLIDSFRYPQQGPGMMWSVCAQKMMANGGRLVMGREVTSCRWDPAAGRWRATARRADGKTESFEGTDLISSAPLRELILGLEPRPPEEVLAAARQLQYRDFVTVGLIVKDPMRFNDNWVYIHDPSVQVGRIQNFKAWSPFMVPDPRYTCYGLEYFCFEGDGLWTTPDEELIALAKSELRKVGLVRTDDIEDGCVIRQKKAYPVYDANYLQCVATIRQEIERSYPTLHLVGRNGMHKYNNQDHAMMTAMVSVKNILAEKKVLNPWAVNQDAEYHEEDTSEARSEANGLRQVSSSRNEL
jgi:protoporphyrinogen oxidase